MEKSLVFFSKNTSQGKKQAICDVLGKIQAITQGKYLGLPMIIARIKFGFKTDKMALATDARD